jgi:hypothetical protein
LRGEIAGDTIGRQQVAHRAVLREQHLLDHAQRAVGGRTRCVCRVRRRHRNCRGRGGAGGARSLRLQPVAQRLQRTLQGGGGLGHGTPAFQQVVQCRGQHAAAHHQRRMTVIAAYQRAEFAPQRGHRAHLGLRRPLGKAPPVGAMADEIAQQLLGGVVAQARREPLVGAQPVGRGGPQQVGAKRLPGFAQHRRRALEQDRRVAGTGLQGGALHQAPEPAVEGVDGDGRLGGGHALVESARQRQGLQRRSLGHAALAQHRGDLLVGAARQRDQVVVEALAHLLGGTPRERDGQDMPGRHARQQQAQHAAHQQPGLAAAGAGLDHAAAGRVERAGDEFGVADGPLVDAVLAHGASAAAAGAGDAGAAATKPWRHRLRSSQRRHTDSAPLAGSGAPAPMRRRSSAMRCASRAALAGSGAGAATTVATPAAGSRASRGGCRLR